VRQAAQRSLLGAGPWVKIHTIDPTAFAWVQARGGTLANRFSLVPDAMDEFTPVARETARRTLDIPIEGRYIVSVGSHAVPRKGSQLLLEAFVRARLGSTDRLLLAGTLGEELKRRLETEFADLYRLQRIVVIDKYLDDADLMNALAASDVVCTPYFDHVISSGIVLRAAQAGRPVLAPRQGWLGDIVPRFQLGETGDILEVAALAAALEKAVERADGFRVSRACERLVEYSSARNFAALWAVRFRERMGLPREDDVRTWEWVLQEYGESRAVARELKRPSGGRFARIYPRSTPEGHIEGSSLDDEP
jgi:glycosyltransferase involved in cell wall biosynthesis